MVSLHAAFPFFERLRGGPDCPRGSGDPGQQARQYPGNSLWHTKQRKCSDAEYTAAERRHLSQGSRADWFVSSCSYPACHTFRNFENLRESFGDRLSFGDSSTEGFPPGIWIWLLWLRALSLSDQTDSGFSLVLFHTSFPCSHSLK